ncbi:MAG: Xaa-Pro aminopeptidase, partial [Myxococcota bacterium]|nr:Xaa-Pro aminopeptidase [Myxococcota bacterium]
MKEIFATRRRRFMDAVGDDAVVVIPGAGHKIRNSDVEYDFRQNSDFYYLTGFDEPDSILVLRAGHDEGESVLFVRPRDPAKEVWTGRRAGVEGAVRDYGVDAAFPISEFDERLKPLCAGARRVGYALGSGLTIEQTVVAAARQHRDQPRLEITGPDEFFNPQVVLHEHRIVKTEAELRCLRRASDITVEAHHEAMRVCRPGCWEYELQAALEYVFVAAGAERVGYSSIVAAGENATILHYNTNRMQVM